MNTTRCLEWSGFLHNLPRYMITLPVLLIYSYCAEKEPNREIVIATQRKCNQIKNKKKQIDLHEDDPATDQDTRLCKRALFVSR